VRDLARELEIPQSIIDKPPSAGLLDGQTDEGEIGITYEDLDKTLKAIESDRTDEVGPQLLEKVRQMIATSAHKRATAPVFEPL
jgi:NAD+ synthase